LSEASETRLERVPSGIAGLDTVLRGGFFRGGLYIVQGPPGTGKTTLANQICFNAMAGGRHALYVTLLAEYHARMIQHLNTMSFFDASKIPDLLTYISGFRVLRQGGSQELLGLLRREIGRHGASILILDGFATAQRSAASAQDFNEFVHELQGIAIATDCTMFLLTSNKGLPNTPEYTIVDGIVELSDDLIGWAAERTLQVVKLRGSDYLTGRHAFRITDDGLAVYPRTEAVLARPSRPDHGDTVKLPSGVARLDSILGGGLPAASTTLVLGPTGVGKTTLGLQFLSACSEQEPGLFFGFYETPARIGAKVDGVCRPLRGLLDAGTVEVLWQPPTDGPLDAYGERLIQAVARRGVRRLFIDGLGAFRNAATNPVRMGHFLNALTNELRVRGVTTVYTLEVTDIIGPTIRAPISDLSSLAENMILLRFVQLRSRLYRLISILKVRDSAFDQSLYEFVTTDRGLVIESSFESAEAITSGLVLLARAARDGESGADQAREGERDG
jgi:circadian clock protein KaiC